MSEMVHHKQSFLRLVPSKTLLFAEICEVSRNPEARLQDHTLCGPLLYMHGEEILEPQQ